MCSTVATVGAGFKIVINLNGALFELMEFELLSKLIYKHE